MTRDIILNTTVEIIRASERNLQLALQVEKAMPVVREELIKEFFKCVEKQLTENIDAEGEWEIRAIGTEVILIRRTYWERLKVKEDSEIWWGVSFSYDDEGPSYINVADVSEISDSVKKQIDDEFRKSTGEPEIGESEMCYWLEDAHSDLKGLDFLKKMVNDKEREEITKDMADKLAKLAKAVDKALNNV